MTKASVLSLEKFERKITNRTKAVKMESCDFIMKALEKLEKDILVYNIYGIR